jgi:glycosyltransferase involved in cell wall biosynthesis
LPLLPIADSGLGRRDFGLDEDAFVFLSTFDFNSSFWRKNPLGAIAAFRMAFPDPEDRVQLLIKSSNGKGYPKLLAQLLDAAAADRRIIVRDEVMEKQHLQSLHRCADCFVSLHRAEGFGLALAESMALAKPVIATGWSGNMEFMTEQNSLPVPYTLLPIPPGQYPHAHGQRWAEPDLREAAHHMRRLATDPALVRTVGARAASDVRSQMSEKTVISTLTERLAAIKSGFALA